jgi:molybdate transport system substrate-binding protein
MSSRTLLLACVLVVIGVCNIVAQSTPPLRVLASNGMKAVVEDLRGQLEREVGRPLNIEFNTSAAVRQRIESGEAFDVAILTSEVINDLAKAGKIASNSVVDLGRSGIGFGVRSGAAKPDIRTPDAVKQTLLNAKSLTWVSVGASRVHIDRMLGSLGIADQVKGKILLTQGVDQSIESVASGKTEMILTLTSEIMPAKGVQYVGPFPATFQNYVAFAAGVSPKSALPAAGALMIKRLSAPAVARAYEARGMELPVVTDTQRRLKQPIK